MNYNDQVRYWINEIDDAKRREKDYRDNGKTITDLYNGENPDQNPFNILYSNTETLLPALYSNLPRPAVRERFTKKDSKGMTQVNPLNKAVAEAANGMLSYMLDSNVQGYDKFHDAVKMCVLDALLPGRGVTAIQFDAKFTDDEIEWASVVANTKKYSRFYHGFATKWEKVPWIAYEEYVDETEAKELFGGDMAAKVQYTIAEEDEKVTSDTEDMRKTACVYQIWDREKEKVFWVSDACTEYLREDDDPLEIGGFFNTPKPLMLHSKSNDLMPTPLYKLYENQAKELNRITRSLNKVIQALKVRGAYDGNFGDELERLMDEEDNVLIPTDKVSSFLDGGFDKHIWFLPLGELAGVATQLYQAREACKQVIYEITGISDILRGSSKASETLGAQKMKESWGTMRLKSMQSEVQEYVRELMRMMLDVAVKNVPQRLWIKVTGLSYPTNKQKDDALEMMNTIKPQLQAAQMEGQPNKKLTEQAAELTQLLSQPSWEDILEVLNDDYLRSFKVDIESNSTLDAEATEDRQQIAEIMNAIAQFMNGIFPMVKEGVLPYGAAKSMLLDVAKRFRFGPEVEDEIKAMQEPKGNPEEMAKKVEEMKKKVEKQTKDLEQTQEKFEEEKRKAGDELDEKFRKLEMEKFKFSEEKKYFMETIKMTRKFEEARRELDAEKSTDELNNILDSHKRDVQSMMDKQVTRIDKAIGDADANLRA